MRSFTVIMMVVSSTLVVSQRPSFAGTRPIGFPELLNRTTTTPDPLENRFGTTQTLPIEVQGNREEFDRISKLPVDQQPFWYLNWKALEEQRKNPQTFPQRPSQFTEPLNVGQNANVPAPGNSGANSNNDLESRFGTPNSGVNPNTGTANSNFGTNSNAGNAGKPNSNIGNVNSNAGSNVGKPNSNFGAPNSNLESSTSSGIKNEGAYSGFGYLAHQYPNNNYKGSPQTGFSSNNRNPTKHR